MYISCLEDLVSSLETGRQTLQNNESQDSTIKTINTCFMDSMFSILSLSQVFSLSLTLFHFIANVNILAAVRLGVVLYAIISVFCSFVVEG
jgi:hypothetical protein